MREILVLVGSFRRHSINQQLADALEQLALKRLTFRYANMAALPHYNDDLWDTPPEAVMALKTAIEAADGVMIVTPEYNRSVPGVIKDALDWGSRPRGSNAWSGKPAAICGASPGAIGTAAAQSQLRSMLPAVGLQLMSQPEVYLTFHEGLIDDKHKITAESTRLFLEHFVAAFADWVDLLVTSRQ
jgi:chromate reductase